MLKFGVEEKLFDLKATNYYDGDEPLWIKGKTTTYYFIGGVYVRNDGCVLAAKGSKDSYIPLPPRGEIVALQEAEILPTPLPEFKIPPLELFMGFLLWIVFGTMAIYTFIQSKFDKRRKLKYDNPDSLVTRLEEPEP